MPFFKSVLIRDAQEKYGFAHKGIFAKEPINKGEAIFTCDLSICPYLKIEEVKQGRTRDETEKMMRSLSKSRDFIHKYIYMVDDDTFDWPRDYVEQNLPEDCMLFNHSCDPNCGFQALDSSLVVAIRNIEPGEELTYDYQCMDTEPSFYDGLDCRCGSFKCRGKLRFDMYRNVDWQNAFYKYSGEFVKRKIDELKTKWFSSSCYLKRYKVMSDSSGSGDVILGLSTLKKIGKDDLVAIFSDPTNISPDAHYIRHSETPTCYLCDNGVYAASVLEPSTEITLNYNKQR
jgi:SET domain-containing protein